MNEKRNNNNNKNNNDLSKQRSKAAVSVACSRISVVVTR